MRRRYDSADKTFSKQKRSEHMNILYMLIRQYTVMIENIVQSQYDTFERYFEL